MSRSYSWLISFNGFRKYVEKDDYDGGLRINFKNLLRVFATHNLLENTLPLLDSGYLTPKQIPLLRDAYKASLKLVAPQALNLIESWMISDNMLNSCIGNKYGDIYEQQLQWAKNSRLNRGKEVPGFTQYMKKYYTSKV